ncbi:peroxiredoxin-like family protein [Pseudalkalibacillus hwajinpoensis]|uniref:peroxiredoxin-like family protein n=1 Tax=Guptibacillus hwajinpoensis TaxID=208199 RepID=UPI001CFCD04A|nr:peroxiredoxin-like family protein [Pseudalkalibacillus hwajinpoensis]
MLKDELITVREKFFSNAPNHVTNNVTQATNELLDSGIATGLTEGDQAPDFTLKNANGKFITLSEELKKGPVILNFYRGGWCPYCNLELRAYEEILNDIKAEGAQLIAISPQTPDQSLTTQEKNNLSYEVLSDTSQEVIKNYNLLFEMPDYLIKTYRDDFNIDLSDFNSKEDPWRLPVAGTVVISQDGTIMTSSANVDYMYRAEPREVLMQLKNKKRI